MKNSFNQTGAAMDLPINDIRKKRLEYYNKYEKNLSESFDSHVERILRNGHSAYSNPEKSESSSGPFNQHQRTKTCNKTNNQTTENNPIESILNSFNEKALGQNRKQSNFDRSLSLDNHDSITFDAVVSKNDKLDQFKKIVEASYIDHVLNKSDYMHSSYMQSNGSGLNIIRPILSAAASNKSDLVDNTTNCTKQISPRPNQMKPDQDADYVTTQPQRIQFLSAYNIYQTAPNTDQNDNDKHLDKRPQPNMNDNFEYLLSDRYETISYRPNMHRDVVAIERKLTADEMSSCNSIVDSHHQSNRSEAIRKNTFSESNGNLDDYVQIQSSSSSSLTLSSPSAHMSLTNRFEPNSMHQVKPPNTKPSTQMPAYRKTIAQRQLSSNSDSIRPKADSQGPMQKSAVSNQTDANQKWNNKEPSRSITIGTLSDAQPFNKTQSDQNFNHSTCTSFALNARATLNSQTIGGNHKRELDHNKQPNDDIDNILRRAHELYDNSDDGSMHDSLRARDDAQQDYYDSSGVYHNTFEIENKQNVALNINLDELSGDDDDDTMAHGDYVVNDDVIVDEDTCMINIQSPSVKQVKPSFIPNLMLDEFNEDDRSISVAASLAKSMCNDIDYKAEMENLLTKESNPIKPSEKMAKPTSLTVSKTFNNYPKQSARVDPKPSTSNQSTTKNLNENIILNLNAKQVNIARADVANTITAHYNAAHTSTNTNNNASMQNKKLHSDHRPPSRITSARESSATFSNKISCQNTSATNNFKFQNSIKKPSIELLSPRTVAKEPNGQSKSLLRTSSAYPATFQKENKVWESADINSKSNIKLNLFTTNNIRCREIRKLSAKSDSTPNGDAKADKNKIANMRNSKSQNFFLSYSKLNQIEASNSNPEPQKSEPVDTSQNNNNAFVKIGSKTIEIKFDLPWAQQSTSSKAENSKSFIPNNALCFEDVVDSNDFITKTKIESNILDTRTLEQYALDDVTNKSADWSQLPHEIWLRILKNLDSRDVVEFGKTCKNFHTLFTDHTLWRKITIKNKNNVCDAWLKWIGKRSPKELNIIQCSGNVGFLTISEMFKTIGTTLNVRYQN